MRIALSVTLGSILFGSVLPAAQEYRLVAIPGANNCIQTNLISTIPDGVFTADNQLATPFIIAPIPATCGITGAGACNFYDAFGFSGAGQALTVDVLIPHVTKVYTLMNAYAPNPGAQIATIEFVGTGGATNTFALVAGEDIRDFYDGSFANTLTNGISGVRALNAFMCSDPSTCLGAGGTGNVDTGYTGSYRVDEQEFTLSSEFASQELVRIVLTDTYNGSVPIILGITVESK
ncbi:MAG: hypothetical protein ABSF64_12345 [Bryobacteraceae bacterium]|jgi:hypothetical protein